MRRIALYILALLPAAAWAVTGSGKQPSGLSRNDSLRYKVFFQEAMKQQINGNYAAAYDLLRHCIGINPDAAEAYFFIASYENMLGNDSVAFAAVKKAADLEPTNNYYLERLGAGYMLMKNYGETIATYEKLSRNSPERSDLLDILLALYGQEKDYDNMLETLKRKEALDGASENITLAKMRVYSLQGKKTEELNELKSLAAKYPNDMNYRVMLANWLLQNERGDEAYEVYQEVLRTEPENVMARMALADYYRAEGHPEQADSLQEVMLISPDTPAESKIMLIKRIVADSERAGGDSAKVLGIFKKILAQPQETSDMAELYAAYMTLKGMPQDSVSRVLETIITLNPDNTLARLQLINAQWEKKDLNRVVELSRNAIDHSPENIAFYYTLGLALYQLDRDDEALDALQKGVARADGQSDARLVSDCYEIIGSIFHAKGHDAKAYEAFDKCLQWDDDNTECLNNYAYYLSEKGIRLDDAAQMSFRAIQAEPDNYNYLDTYAWILFKQKRYAEAAQYIDMALANDTTRSAVLLEHAGDISAMNGNIDTAVRYWTEAAEAGSDNLKALRRKIKQRKYVESK